MPSITAAQYRTYLRNRHQYPGNWKRIVAEIKARAGGRCECPGGDLGCGLHGGRRCTERVGQPAKYAKGRVVLTTMHTCHNPRCSRRDHLRHACSRCHLRYDLPLHRENARRTRERKRGQLLLAYP